MAAVELLHLPDFPARVHLICHLVRDIYNQLPRALGDRTTVRKASEVYPPLVTELRKRWKAAGPMPEADDPTEDRHMAPEVFRALEKLMVESLALEDQARERLGVRLARALFHSVERPPGESIPGWVFESFDREYRFFVKRAHLRLESEPSEDGLHEHFERFEKAFHSMVGRYFTGKDALDAILEDTNRPAD